MKVLWLCTKVFFAAFFINLLWENLHAFLYLHNQGGFVSELVLLRATLVDAVIILVAFSFSRAMPERYRTMFIILTLFVVAILIERWALSTNRWAYSDLMPILPILNSGLTPTIQLAATAWCSIWISSRK